MTQKRSLKLNFVMNAVLTMSSFIFPLISFPYVSRILLPEGTGKVSFATSLIAYFTMFAQLGIPTYGVRACARVRDDRHALTRTAQELLIINLVMTALSYLALVLSLLFIPRLRAERSL
jgi:O-antigen/teichoic acid export membrane protein